MEYGVITHNKFAFLDGDVSDPEEVLAKAEEVTKKDVKTAPPPKKVVIQQMQTTNKQVPAKDAERPHQEVKRGGGTAGFRSRGDGPGRRPPQGDRFGANRDREPGQNNRGGPRPPRQFNNRRSDGDHREHPVGDRETRPPRNNFDGANNESGGNFRRPRGGGGPRGPRGGGRGGGGPRRPMSSDAENKDGENKTKEQGDEPKTEENNAAAGEGGEVELKANDENAQNTNEETKPGEEIEPLPKEKTYEEWKAEQNQKAEQVHFNTRKPGEGADAKMYQKLIPIKKTEKKESKQDEADEYAHKEKREKPLSIDVSFVDKRSAGFGDRGAGAPRGDRQYGGGGQGHRGGPRGGGGGPRNNYGGAGPGPSRRPPQGFTLENEQFPALGAAH